jgi:hypothetical protein
MKTYAVQYRFHFYANTEVEAESLDEARLHVEDYYEHIDYLKEIAKRATDCGVQVTEIEEIEDV